MNKSEKTSVQVRLRPVLPSESGQSAVDQEQLKETVVKVGKNPSYFDPSATNESVWAAVCRPCLGELRAGKSCALFCQGMTGSGKSHSMLGQGDEPGLFFLTVRAMMQELEREGDGRQVQVSFAEIQNKKVQDLLGERAECTIRDDGTGTDLIRSQTTKDEHGRVTVRSLATRSLAAASDAQLAGVLNAALANRRTGCSNVHDQSSRSHALLIAEVVTPELEQVREAIYQAEADIVPIGYQKDVLGVNYYATKYVKQNDGSYIQNPDWIEDPVKQQKIDLLKKEVERLTIVANDLKIKEAEISKAIKNCKIVFADLAGSEQGSDSKANARAQPRALQPVKQQTDSELKEAQEINKSLLALKECIRRLGQNQKHVPWRDSLFTRLIKSFLLTTHSKSKISMLSTIGPLHKDLDKTHNTLKQSAMMIGL